MPGGCAAALVGNSFRLGPRPTAGTAPSFDRDGCGSSIHQNLCKPLTAVKGLGRKLGCTNRDSSGRVNRLPAKASPRSQAARSLRDGALVQMLAEHDHCSCGEARSSLGHTGIPANRSIWPPLWPRLLVFRSPREPWGRHSRPPSSPNRRSSTARPEKMSETPT